MEEPSLHFLHGLQVIGPYGLEGLDGGHLSRNLVIAP